ncbi:MAG: 3-isopropylmalate dehydrogenase [Alphaproteobacteria bacterium]|nr:3-isopropylmalate dehydrogenase [Alphaproteobacteria bacterium]
MARKSIFILSGDGIGPEVTAQAIKILDWFSSHGNVSFDISHGLIGGAAIDATGTPLPDATLEQALAADSVLLGAVGGPKWDTIERSIRPERGLLGIRKGMGLFANLRPAVVFEELADASTLKHDVVAGLDIMIVRELTGDVYFGQPRGIQTAPDGSRVGINTMIYHDYEVQRIAKVAFELARKRKNNVCSVDKANVLESTEMWRQEVQKLHDLEYTDIHLSHMYVDNAAMQLVRNPKQFDVIVTGNIFGDILSDCAAMLTGSLGMLPSASLGARQGDKQPSLYEPVHGSAPDIAGKDMANPIATILSLSMMLRYSFDMTNEADKLEAAVKKVLSQGLRTGDIMQPGMEKIGTNAMGNAILKALND